MHSFHPSRGRILFEVFCALTIAGSCALAWLQTYASAFLVIAAVTALYAVVRATDLRRRPMAVATEMPGAEPVVDDQGDLLAYEAPVVEPVAAAVAEPEPAPKPKRRARKKQAPVEAVIEVIPEPEVAEAVEAAAEPEVADTVEVVPEPVDFEEEYHAPVTPLFEPQPLVRQQRTVFGRKAG